MVSADDRFSLSSRRGRRGPGRGGFSMAMAPLSGSLPARASRGERDKLFVASNRLFTFGQGDKVHSPNQELSPPIKRPRPPRMEPSSRALPPALGAAAI